MCFFFLCPLWCPCLCIIFSAGIFSRVGFIADEHLDGSVRHLLDLRFGLPDDVGISSSSYLMKNFNESLKPASSHIQFKTLCSINIEGESNNIAQQQLRQQQQQQQKEDEEDEISSMQLLSDFIDEVLFSRFDSFDRITEYSFSNVSSNSATTTTTTSDSSSAFDDSSNFDVDFTLSGRYFCNNAFKKEADDCTEEFYSEMTELMMSLSEESIKCDEINIKRKQ